jgi:hypothetical protein
LRAGKLGLLFVHLRCSDEGQVVIMDCLLEFLATLDIKSGQVTAQDVNALLCQAAEIALQIKALILKCRKTAQPNPGPCCSAIIKQFRMDSLPQQTREMIVVYRWRGKFFQSKALQELFPSQTCPQVKLRLQRTD